MSPFSAAADIVADINGWNAGDDLVRLSIMLSTDEGPAREFRRFVSFDLDEAHATELVGELAVALAKLRDARKAVAA